ncbi:MAG TPA: YjdF family protein [Candidatus Pelethocola excrementipullorum]|nr:YjdF family protein [Candidatus Pelethocola excrementipullorum]
MQKINGKLTVFFEDPFWVGIYERITEGRLEVCKITFGPEPKDYEVHDFILQNWYSLRFSPPVVADGKQTLKVNPKRMQRKIKKQLKNLDTGTKAQQALKLQHEENKILRKDKSHLQKAEKKQLQFELRQQKRKAKHKGK